MANRSSVGFGLRPIGKVGQNRDNQGLSEYSVATSPTIIYFNDAVRAVDSGTIAVAAAGNTLLGSLNGSFYTDPTTQKPTWRNYVPSVAASDIVAFVSDDPYERFEIRSNNTAASAQTDVFNLANITYLAGDSANYVSRTRLNDATLSTTTNQLQILGATKDSGDNAITQSHVVWVVRIANHLLTNRTTGV
jgi:hypothetical protein